MALGSRDPWVYARVQGRDYLTPEDVVDAIKAGVGRTTIYRIVLDAIESRAAEDYRLCAFVALNEKRPRPKRRKRSVLRHSDAEEP
jgi:hypothetical protein